MTTMSTRNYEHVDERKRLRLSRYGTIDQDQYPTETAAHRAVGALAALADVEDAFDEMEYTASKSPDLTDVGKQNAIIRGAAKFRAPLRQIESDIATAREQLAKLERAADSYGSASEARKSEIRTRLAIRLNGVENADALLYELAADAIGKGEMGVFQAIREMESFDNPLSDEMIEQLERSAFEATFPDRVTDLDDARKEITRVERARDQFVRSLREVALTSIDDDEGEDSPE